MVKVYKINLDGCWYASDITQEDAEREILNALYNGKNLLSIRKGIHTQNWLENFQSFLPIHNKLGKILKGWKILVSKEYPDYLLFICFLLKNYKRPKCT